MMSAMLGCVLGVSAAALGGCQSNHSPVFVNGSPVNADRVAVSSPQGTPVVVMTQQTGGQPVSTFTTLSTVAQQTVNAAATGLQQLGSSVAGPQRSKPAVYTTDSNVIVVQRQSTWTPFPAAAPQYPNVYVVGGSGAVQPAGTPGAAPAAITPAQLQQAIDASGQRIYLPR